MIQLLWLTLLAIHTGAAAVWWWLMPGGFPSSSPAFWVNQVAPPILVGVFAVALFARGRLSEAILPPLLAAICTFWMAFAISARIVFFESFRSAWNLPFFAAAVLAGLWVKQFRFRVRPVWLAPTLALLAAVAGWKLPLTLRAPDPSTAPDGAPFGSAPAGSSDHKLVKLTRNAQLRPADGRVVVRNGDLVLNVEPLLSFADRSPDRYWTGDAPDEPTAKTVRTLVAKTHEGGRFTLYYKDEDASVLDVTAAKGAVELDSRSRLPHAIFSHANSFAELSLQGHHALSVAFSPAPDRHIEIPSSTAPARFATLDASGTFRVLEASARRHGPFTELARGRLGRGDPLTLTFYDGARPIFIVRLDDWARQASTDLSPAAGWEIPMNAIELERLDASVGAPALVTFTLAATTIGRGTPTVGHAAGVYRDRITVTVP